MGGRASQPQRALDLIGWVFAAIGLLGLILRPGLYLVWVFMIVFGFATLPRTLLQWIRARRRPKKRDR